MTGSPRIVFCAPGAKPEPWLRDLKQLLPDAKLFAWTAGIADVGEPADYAIVWSPPDAFYADQPRLKAIFNLGAGVDGLMRSTALPSTVPVIRVEDAGMAQLMAEYVVQAAVRHARELDLMEADSRQGRWAPRKPTDRDDYPVGVMGAGALGLPVARALVAQGFAVSIWARSPKAIEGMRAFAGASQLDAFLATTRILVCVLPLTSATDNILNRETLGKLKPGACVINVARGSHLVDEDLLELMAEGHIAAATLDVFREEPLPAGHRFWKEPRITITPHCSALTQRKATLAQIAAKIEKLEHGEPVGGVVNRERGY